MYHSKVIFENIFHLKNKTTLLGWDVSQQWTAWEVYSKSLVAYPVPKNRKTKANSIFARLVTINKQEVD